MGAEAGRLFGATGPVLRSTGVLYDVRLCKHTLYGFYSNLSVRSYVGLHGDSFDRFLIRARELFESLSIIYKCISEFTYYSSNHSINYHCVLTKAHGKTPKTKLESLIRLFRHVNADYSCRTGLVYRCVESGKGEFGITLVSNNSNKPHRLAIRSPAYAHLQLLNLISNGHQFADIATLIGSLDVVFGEIDR